MHNSASPLEAAVARLKQNEGGTFGLSDAVLGMLALPFGLIVLIAFFAVGPDLPDATLEVIVAVTVASCGILVPSYVARKAGGYREALGFDIPRWSDAGGIIKWSMLTLFIQSVIFASLSAIGLGAHEDEAGIVPELPTAAIAILATLTVLVTPVVEELLFRGVILRGLLLHGLSFWKSAFISSAVFGLLHASSVQSEALPAVLASAAFGLLQCINVERAGRLGPAIAVHAITNLVVMLTVLASA